MTPWVTAMLQHDQQWYLDVTRRREFREELGEIRRESVSIFRFLLSTAEDQAFVDVGTQSSYI